MDLQEPKYPSNLSAALYEAGKYTDAIKSVRDAWKRLHSSASGSSLSPTDPLAIKLSIRLAKSKINAVCTGAISLHERASAQTTDRERTDAVLDEEVEKFGVLRPDTDAEDPKAAEVKAVWGYWRAIRSQCASHLEQQCQAQKRAAEVRFRALRIFKFAS